MFLLCICLDEKEACLWLGYRIASQLAERFTLSVEQRQEILCRSIFLIEISIICLILKLVYTFPNQLKYKTIASLVSRYPSVDPSLCLRSALEVNSVNLRLRNEHEAKDH